MAYGRENFPRAPVPVYDTSSLIGQAISTTSPLRERSRSPITELGLSIPVAAVVILLGEASCSQIN